MMDRPGFSGSFPQVAMMQPADNRHLDHPADLRRLDLPRCRGVLAQRKMSSIIVIVVGLSVTVTESVTESTESAVTESAFDDAP